MSNPVAVLISDIHYNLQTLPVADAALRQAVDKANELDVPLIIAGDLHDTKANLRAECVNAMRKTLEHLIDREGSALMVGNHDKINEKSKDNALSFVDEFIPVYSGREPIEVDDKDLYIIPYQHDLDAFKAYLDTVPKGSTIIMHQGVHAALSGEYIRDHTAVPKEWLKDYRVISGHYHTRQTIRTNPEPQRGYVGLLDYIGNPYTLNYAEVNDPPKGFQILNNDGSLTFVPTNLRQHIIFDIPIDRLEAYAPAINPSPDDLVWVKIKGPSDRLAKLTKSDVAAALNLKSNFKFDMIPEGIVTQALVKEVPPNELLDQLIDSIENADDTRKERLKTLWKSLLGG